MTKNQVKYRLQKLYRFLEDGHIIEFKRMKFYRGFIVTHKYPTVVQLDYTDKLFPTLIHEFLHYIHPDWCESKILRAEREFVAKLTDRQIRNILKKFAESL